MRVAEKGGGRGEVSKAIEVGQFQKSPERKQNHSRPSRHWGMGVFRFAKLFTTSSICFAAGRLIENGSCKCTPCQFRLVFCCVHNTIRLIMIMGMRISFKTTINVRRWLRFDHFAMLLLRYAMAFPNMVLKWAILSHTTQ